MTDPRTLFTSAKDIEHAQQQIQTFKSTGKIPEGVSNEDMWTYKKIVSSCIHPVTGQVIPLLFRPSAIAPVNIPLVSFMISVPATNVPMTLFLHFANQSYNTACNYANRSGATMSNEDIMTAYSLAVSSACCLAFGLGRFVQNKPGLKKFGILIPMIATSAANISNIALTRSSEMTRGIPVVDGEGEVRGVSKVAGIQVVS